MKSFIIGVIIFAIGIKVGKSIRTRQINMKIEYLENLANEVKIRNNRMVETLSTICEASGRYTPGTLTDLDERLFNMWID